MSFLPSPTPARNPGLILRARLVLPVCAPAIEDGAVRISGGRISAVGRWDALSGRRGLRIDLGDSVLLPGLVNAHCHLDYTHMAGMMPPQRSFTNWIKLITSAKSEWNYSEFAASWLAGADMLVRTGTTTLADFEAVPELLPDVWSATPLRVISFLELTGVRSRRDPRQIVRQALDRIEGLPSGRSRAAIAPHAPYSTVPELLRLSAAAARRRRWPLSIHVAESPEEFEMFEHGRGELFEWLRRNERDMSDCGKGSPLCHLQRHRVLGKNLLAVHVNYISGQDSALLGKNRVSVAHCPRSHAYFQHERFPFRELARARVNVCLGTDSLATVYKTRRASVRLSLFEEMRCFASIHPRVSPKSILAMATLNGARALGLRGRSGQIAPGAFGDLIAIPFAGKTADVYDAVVHYPNDVTASLIGGQWAVPPG